MRSGTTKGMKVGEERELLRTINGNRRIITIRKVRSTGFPQFRILENRAA